MGEVMGRKNTNARRKAKHMPMEHLVAPTDAQLTNGIYKAGFVMDDAGLKAWTFKNTNHDPVERWNDAGRLEAHQLRVIDHMRRLWRLTGLEQRVTASYGERIPGSGSSELACINEIEARKDLKRIEAFFPYPLSRWFNVFEDVCRHGTSAGLAGEALGLGTRSADVRAHLTVCFVADVIADRERV